jgi:pimeloyl-ACP methyl ester carboxylesterase
METTTSRDGTLIAYDVRGDGPPLVYITGATCSRSFLPVVRDSKTFASAFRAVTYDRRGRGASGDTMPWSVAREVEDIDALIEDLGGEAFLYGHSSGAVLAMHAALSLGPKVRGLMMYDAPWVHDAAEREEYAVLRAQVELLLDQGRNAAATRRFLTGIGMPRLFVAMLPLLPGWRTMVELAPTLRYDLALTADFPPLQLAAEVGVPTHILVGERSPSELHEVARALAGAVPGATLTTVPKQDHMVAAKTLLPVLVNRFCNDNSKA